MKYVFIEKNPNKITLPLRLVGKLHVARMQPSNQEPTNLENSFKSKPISEDGQGDLADDKTIEK